MYYNVQTISEIDFKKITTLVWDLGGIWFEIDYQRPIDAFTKLGVNGIDSQFNFTQQAPFFHTYERGEIATGEFVGHLMEQCKPDTSPKHVIEAWNSILIGMSAQRCEQLVQLKKNWSQCLLSNINELHIAGFTQILADQHPDFEFDAQFDTLFYSCRIGHRKPEPACYQYVIEHIGVAPEHILFVDDTPANVKAAAELGIQSVWINRSAGESVDLLFPYLGI